eukprot:gene19584-16455_t
MGTSGDTTNKKAKLSLAVLLGIASDTTIAAAAAAAAAAATCPPSMHIVEGQCTIGTAYKWITQPTTIEECCSLCAADAGKCSGFTLRNDTASRTSPGKVTCSLKTGPLGRTRPGCIASGSVAPLPPPPSPSPPPPSPSPPKPPPASGLTVSDMLLGVGGAVPVLQRNTAVSIWGTAVPGAVVKVELVGNGDLFTATADSKGNWITFGETVLCAGQSNMGMQVGPSVRKFDADNATAENAASVLY